MVGGEGKINTILITTLYVQKLGVRFTLQLLLLLGKELPYPTNRTVNGPKSHSEFGGGGEKYKQ
jgi:hypothetical protein